MCGKGKDDLNIDLLRDRRQFWNSEAVRLSQWLLEVIGLSRQLPETNGFHVTFGEAKEKNTRFLIRCSSS